MSKINSACTQNKSFGLKISMMFKTNFNIVYANLLTFSMK